MKILIASKFFYMRGGAELVAINTRRLLLEHGHEVRVFAMSYPHNLPLAEQDTFPAQVELFGSLGDKVRGLRRMLGCDDVRQAARRALDDFKPDVVHLHNVHSYLSPLIAEEAHRRGIRVVWTLHDYKLFCPSYSCRRPDGTICSSCIRSPFDVVSHRCMKGSLAASLVAYAEALRWSRKRLEKMVDVYVAPSDFMGEMMVKAGFDASKVAVLCNFVDPDKLEVLTGSVPRTDDKEPYFCYIGRLSHEKGVETMLRAARQACVRLKVAGRGPLFDELKREYAGSGIEFLGHLDAPQVAALLQGATASVLPSEWYENNPLGVIESLSAGTPVIGARMGGIPELIEEGADGFTYPSGDTDALAACIRRVLATDFDRAAIALRARERFSLDTHYRRLMDIYEDRL